MIKRLRHTAVRAPLAGTVVSVTATPGSPVAPGDELLVIEAMKVEHEVRAQAAGLVHEVPVAAGATGLAPRCSPLRLQTTRGYPGSRHGR